VVALLTGLVSFLSGYLALTRWLMGCPPFGLVCCPGKCPALRAGALPRRQDCYALEDGSAGPGNPLLQSERRRRCL